MEKICFIIKTKSSLRSFLSSLPISKVLKQNLMYFGHIPVETEPSRSHKLAIFLNYRMPLIPCVTYPIPTLLTLFVFRIFTLRYRVEVSIN